MAINVADNFSYKGSKPLDARITYATVAAMAGAATADLYDGCFAYVTATQKYYSYDSSNTTDPTTGKWREFSSGGGGGGSYTAGDGIDITNDVISTDNMPAADMSEIVTPLPGVMSRTKIYSPEEQVVAEWREYVDGVLKKKPVYEKTLPFTQSGTVATSSDVVIDSSMTINSYKLIDSFDIMVYSSGGYNSGNAWIRMYFAADGLHAYCTSKMTGVIDGASGGSFIVIRYLKLADEWEVV